jgi:hypothetical protein
LFLFDAVFVHGAPGAGTRARLAPAYRERLRAYPGLKVLIPRSEDDCTDLRQNMDDLGLQLLPEDARQAIRTAMTGADTGSRLDVQLAELGVGVKPRPSLPPVEKYWLLEALGQRCRLVPASALADKGPGFPSPPEVERSSLGRGPRWSLLLRRAWRRLPTPAQAVMRPPLKIARSAYRGVRALLS